jgi:hypothetical protein
MRIEDDQRFESELQRAFGAEDPGDLFTQRVLARLKTDAAPSRRTMANVWRVAVPFAASLAIAAGGSMWLQHARYVEEGQRARAEVLKAMRLTSEKLNVVRDAVIETQEPR